MCTAYDCTKTARRRPVCPLLKLEFKVSSFPLHAKPMDFEQRGKSLSAVARSGFSAAACEHQKGRAQEAWETAASSWW